MAFSGTEVHEPRMGCDINPERAKDEVNTNCNSAPEVFGFNIVGTGTVTASGSTQFLNQDAIFQVQYSFVGVASEAPEPPGWLFTLSGLGVLGWIARKRILRKASLPGNAF